MGLTSGFGTISATSTNGGIVLTPLTDSTTMFQLQQAGGTTTFLTADSSNKRLRIGDSNAPGYTLDVAGKFEAGISGGASFWGIAEGSAPGGLANEDVCYGDSSAHAIKCSYNAGTYYPATQTIGTNTGSVGGSQIAALHSQSFAITVTGATTSDVAQCSLNTAMPANWQTGIQMLPPVVTANTVTVWLSNPTGGNITPAATTVRCTVTR